MGTGEVGMEESLLPDVIYVAQSTGCAAAIRLLPLSLSPNRGKRNVYKYLLL